MTLLVQEYLKSKSLETLEKEHGVKARVHDHKFSLNYSQIESADHDKLAQECRGLVLTPSKLLGGLVPTSSPVGFTHVLCRPFDRFFNLGQEAAADVELDHPKTAFFEKLDGTLCNLYYDFVKGQWCVATRSIPEANLPIDGFGDHTFRTLFEKAIYDTLNLNFYEFVDSLDPNHTYMWELTTPLNRIVVEYNDYRVTLLGCRHNENGKELDVKSVAHSLNNAYTMNIPHAPVYHFGSVTEMVEFVSNHDPKKHEGIVVCDRKFRRIKVKNPSYLALNRVRDSVLNSPRGLVELILLEKLDDALSLFPEHIQDKAKQYQENFRAYLHTYNEIYETCLEEANKDAPIFNEDSPSLLRQHRKAFALAVQKHNGWMTPMMEQYQGRVTSLYDWIFKKRNTDGGWSNGFLDSLLKNIK